MQNCFKILIAFTILSQSALALEDHVILKSIFQTVDPSGNSYTFDAETEGDYSHPYFPKHIYTVDLKEKVQMDGKEYIFTVISAETGYLHYSTFSTVYMHLFDPSGQVISHYTKGDPADLYANIESLEVVKIGHNKNALQIISSNAGNGHAYRSVSLSHITKDELKPTIGLSLNFSRGAWFDWDAVGESEECTCTDYEGDFEIIGSDKEWYDIELVRTNFSYSLGCKERIEQMDAFCIEHDGEQYTSFPELE
jgi:hypothetical protein